MKKLHLFWFIIVLLTAGLAHATVIDIIEGPSDQYGLCFDGEYLWVGSSNDDNSTTAFYKVDPEDGSILNTYPIHGDEIRGIAYDGEYLYLYSWDFGANNTDYIYTVDPSDGSRVDSVEGPWTSNDYCGGMTYYDGYLYISRYYPDDPTQIHKVSIETGESVSTIPSPCTQPQGVAHDDTSLWVVGDDFNNEDALLYHIDPDDGALFDDYWAISEDQGGTVNPRGLTMTDDGMLWMAANWTDAQTGRGLYLIVPGDNQPIISVSVEEIDFGYTVLEETAEIEFIIENIGTVDLVLDSAIFDEHFDYELDPQNPVIAPDGQVTVIASFTPDEFGLETTTATIYSNDPIHPAVDIFAQGFGVYSISGPEAVSTIVDFGSVWIPHELNGIASDTITIYNPGMDDLILESMTFVGEDGFSAEDITPYTLAVMETVQVAIFFQPTLDSDYECTLEFTNDNTDDILTFFLSGHGSLFTQDFGNPFWFGHIQDSPKVTAVEPFGDINGDGIREILVTHDDAKSVCIDGASSGHPIIYWTFDTGTNNYNTGYPLTERDVLAAGDLNGDEINDVVIGCGGGNEHVYALNGLDGSIIWSFGDDEDWDLGDINEVCLHVDITGDGVREILAAAGDNSSGDGRRSVYCFNGATGALEWMYETGGSAYSVCSIWDINGDTVNDVVGVNGGDTNHLLAIIDGANGTGITSFDPGGPIWQVLFAGDLTDDVIPDIITADFYDGITARSGATGEILWQYTTGSLFTEVELIGDVNRDAYYDFAIVNLTETIPLLDGCTGEVMWTFTAGDNILDVEFSPDLDNDLLPDVLLTSLDGTVRAASGADGTEIFMMTPGNGAVEVVHSMDDIDNNRSPEILFGTRNGDIACISGGDLIEDYPIIAHNPGYIELYFYAHHGDFILEETPDTVYNVGTDTLFLSIEDIVWTTGYIDPDYMTPSVTDSIPPGGSGLVALNITDEFEGDGIIGYVLLTTNAPGTESDTVWIDAIWAVDEDKRFLPDEYALKAPYPNPFNSTVRIGYTLPETADISMRVYDVLGREVVQLATGLKQAGRYELAWNGRSASGSPVASGIYFVQMKAGGHSFIQQVHLIK